MSLHKNEKLSFCYYITEEYLAVLACGKNQCYTAYLFFILDALVTKSESPIAKGSTFISKTALERKPRRILRNTVFNGAATPSVPFKQSPMPAQGGTNPREPAIGQVTAQAPFSALEQLNVKIDSSLSTLATEEALNHDQQEAPELLTSGVLAELCLDDYPLAEIDVEVDYPYQVPGALERIINGVCVGFIRDFLGTEFSQVLALNMEDFPAYASDMQVAVDIQIPPPRIGLHLEFICALNTPREPHEEQDSVERDKFEKFICFNLIYDEKGVVCEIHLPLELCANAASDLHSRAGVAAVVEKAETWLRQNNAAVLPDNIEILPCLTSGLVRAAPVPAVLSQMAGQRQGVGLLAKSDQTMKGLSSNDAVYLYCGLVAFKSPYWLLPFHLIRQRPAAVQNSDNDVVGLVELGNNRLHKSQATIALDWLRCISPNILENRGVVRLPGPTPTRPADYLPLAAFSPELALSTDEILNSTAVLHECDVLELTSGGLVRYLTVLEQFLFDELTEQLNISQD